jgi:hypothetical protein
MPMSNEARRIKRTRRVKQGLCARISCPDKHEPGRTMCQRHLDMNAAQCRKQAAKALAAGKCQQCGHRPLIAGLKHCKECLRSQAELNRAAYAKYPSKRNACYWARRAAGICVRCGNKPARPDRTRCVACAVIGDAQDRERRQLSSAATDR